MTRAAFDLTSRMRQAALLGLVLGAAGLQGCGFIPPSHPPVPAVLNERVPPAPRSPVALIWQPGHYDWDGARYDWVDGRWVPRAGHGTLWQDGYWDPSGGTSVWVPAHWI